MTDTWSEILRMTRELAEQHAKSRKRTLIVSAEAAALLHGVEMPTEASEKDTQAGTPDDAAVLRALEEEVRGCTKCGLCETRTQTVFSDGNPAADVVFIGEAPGADEDRQGVPFVGRAGQLLTRIIEGGMKISRQDVYICNVLKCRPPKNRDPQVSERMACFPYLRQQLALVKPKVICCLGRHAANALLGTELGTGRLRGSWHFFDGIPVRVTYHPSYLLRLDREPDRLRQEKRKVWTDIQEVMKVLNGEITPSPDSSS